MKRVELYNDHFQNFKVYGIPHAQLIIADPPYNLGKNAYASNPAWSKDRDNKNTRQWNTKITHKQRTTPKTQSRTPIVSIACYTISLRQMG